MGKDKAGTSARTVPRKSVGDVLVEEGLITGEQLEHALELQRTHGGKLSEILVNQGLVKAEDLAAVLSIQLNIPLMDLKRHMVQPNALRLIPEDIARKYRTEIIAEIPYKKEILEAYSKGRPIEDESIRRIADFLGESDVK